MNDIVARLSSDGTRETARQNSNLILRKIWGDGHAEIPRCMEMLTESRKPVNVTVQRLERFDVRCLPGQDTDGRG